MTEDETRVTLSRLQQLASRLLPYHPIEVGITNFPGRNVVYALIEPAPEHVGPVMTASGEVFVRRGAQNYKLQESEALAFYKRYHQDVESYPLTKSIKALVAMSFREEEEPSLVDYFNAMKRAVQKTKLPIQLTRMDLIEGDYEISQEIMDRIDECDLVIADFTLNPRNVYFELGYARGTNKRVVQTARQGTVLEFDVRNWRTHFYKNATELEEKLELALSAAYTDLTS